MSLLKYIFIFYVGYYFYRLAEDHQMNKWITAISGIGAYLFANGIYIYVNTDLLETEIDNFNFLAFSFKSFICGLVFTLIYFQILNFYWNSKKKKSLNEVDKIGKE